MCSGAPKGGHLEAVGGQMEVRRGQLDAMYIHNGCLATLIPQKVSGLHEKPIFKNGLLFGVHGLHFDLRGLKWPLS